MWLRVGTLVWIMHFCVRSVWAGAVVFVRRTVEKIPSSKRRTFNHYYYTVYHHEYYFILSCIIHTHNRYALYTYKIIYTQLQRRKSCWIVLMPSNVILGPDRAGWYGFYAKRISLRAIYRLLSRKERPRTRICMCTLCTYHAKSHSFIIEDFLFLSLSKEIMPCCRSFASRNFISKIAKDSRR